jgi:hypothetical protein
MLIDLIYSSTLWINLFPPKGGVSTHLSPRNIMTGIQFDYNKHCKATIWQLRASHEEPSPTNTQAARTVGAICLGPTGNSQGSYKFLNLRTGKRITRISWTSLPMPQEVIDRVNQLGKAEGQPELLTFYDGKGHLIGESEIPGVPDTSHPTIPDDDRLGDLNPITVNYDYGQDQPPDINLKTDTTVKQPLDPTDTPGDQNIIPPDAPNPYEQVESNQPDSTNEPILELEPLNQGATVLRHSQRVRTKPLPLVTAFHTK